jgi:signal transduction histidine kinase
MPALEGTLLRTTEPAALSLKVVELDSHRMRAMAAREEVEPRVRDEPEDRLEDILADLEAGSAVQLVSDDTNADCELLLEDVRATLGPVLRDTSGILSSGPLPVLPVPANQIAQVLQILVSNGLKYRSEAPPRIHVRAERDGPRWQLQVEDNGRGVGAAARDRIFERFQRGRVGDSVPGTGIGLAVCKRIVEGHGGRIWVKPSSSGGSVFTFTVPLADRLPMQA